METVTQPPVTLTDRALARAKMILQKPENQGKALRIFVMGGGCAGLNYSMAIGFVKPDDYVLESDGCKVVVDPKSMSFLKGMQVDFYESIQSSGFKFNNPNAIASCGCGLSFKTAQITDLQSPNPAIRVRLLVAGHKHFHMSHVYITQWSSVIQGGLFCGLLKENVASDQIRLSGKAALRRGNTFDG